MKIVIASGKGGVGKSSVTAGLAGAFQELGKSVLVVDCDIGLRSLDLMLDACENLLFNWGDVIAGRCSPEQATVATACGATLLAAPKSFEVCYTFEGFEAMLRQYEDRFDYILLDSPAGIGSGFALAGSVAKLGLIVATPDDVCVRNGAVASDRLFEMGVKRCRLIINRFRSKASLKGKLLNIDDVIDSTSVQLIGVIPEDNTVMFNLSRGKELPRKSAAAKAMLRIAMRIDGKDVPLKM